MNKAEKNKQKKSSDHRTPAQPARSIELTEQALEQVHGGETTLSSIQKTAHDTQTTTIGKM